MHRHRHAACNRIVKAVVKANLIILRTFLHYQKIVKAGAKPNIAPFLARSCITMFHTLPCKSVTTSSILLVGVRSSMFSVLFVQISSMA
eukprot:6184904-Pleurochrysis_carterae.AAC.1